MTDRRFRDGQIVGIRGRKSPYNTTVVARVLCFDGIFYTLEIEDGLHWREEELRPLTDRERGPRRRRKGRP